MYKLILYQAIKASMTNHRYKIKIIKILKNYLLMLKIFLLKIILGMRYLCHNIIFKKITYQLSQCLLSSSDK